MTVAFDQGLSSLTNLLVSVAAARALSIEEFGAFGITFATYLLINSISRAGLGETLLLVYNDRESQGTFLRAGLRVGIIGGLVVALLSLATPTSIGSAFLALAACMPGLIVLDACRYLAFARKRPLYAVLIDLSWLALSAAILFGLYPVDGTWQITLAWGASGAAVGLLGMFLLRDGQSDASGTPRSWIGTHSGTSRILATDSAAVNLNTQSVPFLLGTFQTLQSNAAFRGAQVLMGPVNILSTATTIYLVPALKATRGSRRKQVVLSVLGPSPLVLVAGAWVGMLWGLPTQYGVELLGDSWISAKQLLPAFLALVTIQAFGNGALLGLRVNGLLRRGLIARFVLVALSLSTTLLTASNFGIDGVAWGLVATTFVSACTWWTIYVVALARTTNG